MRIETNINGWVIRSDSMNIILCRSAGVSTNQKTGREQELFKDETYHRDLQGALESLCRKEINACQATTFTELKNRLTEIIGAIRDMTEAVGESPLKRTISEMGKER